MRKTTLAKTGKKRGKFDQWNSPKRKKNENHNDF